MSSDRYFCDCKMNELEAGQLVRVLPDWKMGSPDINIVNPAGRAAKPSARAFADFRQAKLRALQAAQRRRGRIASQICLG